MSDIHCDQTGVVAQAMRPIPSGTLADSIVDDMSVITTHVISMAKTKGRSSSTGAMASGSKGVSALGTRVWSVRAHAQGHIIGGTSGATRGDTPVVKADCAVTVDEGLAHAQRTFNKLNRIEAAALQNAYDKCVKYVRSRPPNGYLGPKTFQNDYRTSNRFDMDSFGLSNNFTT